MRDIVFIVAGGESLIGFNFGLLAGHDTIVVNKALFNVQKPTYFITMDYSFMMKCPGAVEQLPPETTKVFVAGLDVPYLVEQNGVITDIRSGLTYDLKLFDVVIKSKAKDGLGKDFNHFCNGWNSGFCAFQFAIIMGYQRIVLLGIDLAIKVKTHFHGGYGEKPETFAKKLMDYYESFVKGLSPALRNGQQVFNASEGSKLTELLGYTPIQEILQWPHQQSR